MKTYSVQLTDADIKLIEDALKSHEAKAVNDSLMGTMLGAMFTTPDKREQFMSDSERDMELARAKRNETERRALKLRAKIIDCMERPSEYETVSTL